MPRIGIGRGFEHRAENSEIVEKFFSKVLKISRFFRFRGHWTLRKAALPTECYRIMGQNMGQVLSGTNKMNGRQHPYRMPPAIHGPFPG